MAEEDQRQQPLKDVCLIIRRHKTAIFLDVMEASTVLELKRNIAGILKRPPEEQRLYKNNQLLDDSKTLKGCGFLSEMAQPQNPATVGLAFPEDEALYIEPFSSRSNVEKSGNSEDWCPASKA